MGWGKVARSMMSLCMESWCKYKSFCDYGLNKPGLVYGGEGSQASAHHHGPPEGSESCADEGRQTMIAQALPKFLLTEVSRRWRRPRAPPAPQARGRRSWRVSGERASVEASQLRRAGKRLITEASACLLLSAAPANDNSMRSRSARVLFSVQWADTGVSV